MPDDTETVRHAYDAWNWYGLERLAPFLADDVCLEDAPQLPDARTTTGLDAVIARLDEIATTEGGGWVEITAIDPAGDAVLVAMTWKLDAAEGETTLGQVFHLVDLEEGKITRIRAFLDAEQARAAAQ